MGPGHRDRTPGVGLWLTWGPVPLTSGRYPGQRLGTLFVNWEKAGRVFLLEASVQRSRAWDTHAGKGQREQHRLAKRFRMGRLARRASRDGPGSWEDTVLALGVSLFIWWEPGPWRQLLNSNIKRHSC